MNKSVINCVYEQAVAEGGVITSCNYRRVAGLNIEQSAFLMPASFYVTTVTQIKMPNRREIYYVLYLV